MYNALLTLYYWALPFVYDIILNMFSLNKNQKDIILRIIILIYSLVLVYLNVIRIFDNTFWGDECFSINCVNNTFAAMIDTTAKDVHPPLYYIFLYAMINVFGNHDWVYHLTSVIPFILCVIFANTIIIKRFGYGACKLFLTLAGLSVNAIFFNVEVRMYSLGFMFVLFSYYGLYKILHGEKYGEIIFFINSLAAAYTHYYALVTVAFFYLALLIQTIRKKYEIKKLLILYAATIISYLPWLFILLESFSRVSGGYWIQKIYSLSHYFRYFFNSKEKIYPAAMSVCYILIVFYLINDELKIFYYHIKPKKISGELDTDTIFVLWGAAAGIGTILVGQIVSIIYLPMFIERYLHPATSAIWLSLCVGMARLKKKKFLPYALILISLVAFVPQYQKTYIADKTLNELNTKTHNILLENIKKGDVIFVNGVKLGWTILKYYMPGVTCIEVRNGFSGDFNTESSNINYFFLRDKGADDGDLSSFSLDNHNAKKLGDGFLGDAYITIYKLVHPKY